MPRHRFDPFAAALGIAAIALGIVVCVGRADRLVAEPVWWIAVAALLAGIGLVPWQTIGRKPVDASVNVVTAQDESHATPIYTASDDG